jgi:hypothetical protein
MEAGRTRRALPNRLQYRLGGHLCGALIRGGDVIYLTNSLIDSCPFAGASMHSRLWFHSRGTIMLQRNRQAELHARPELEGE